MRTFSFQTRLWLGHVIVLAVMLALAAFGADWALRRMVLGRVIDDALVSLAWTEATALQRDPAQALRGHEVFERFYEIGSPQGLRDFEDFIASSKASRAESASS